MDSASGSGKGKKYRVLVSDPIAKTGIELLQTQPQFDVVVKLKMPLDQLKAEIAEADVLAIRSETKVTAEILEHAKKLKVIGRAGVGVDNVDVPAATRKGVIVVNAPEGNTIAAAEHAFALLLSMARNIPAAHVSMKAGEWNRSRFIGRELFEKTLGIVGLGRIGREMARRAKAFEMEVLACDPLISAEKVHELGIELVDLKTLLGKADFLSLHAALTAETKRMIGREQFAMMKSGVRIINCARGGLIDQDALVKALADGKVAGAALDVFETEPLAADSPLRKIDNLILTPHLGASTEEAQVNVSVVVAEQIRDYLLHGMVRNAVNAPTPPPEVMREIGPYLKLAEKMGRFLIQLADGAPRRIELEYIGEISHRDISLITASAVKGMLAAGLREQVNEINALTLAKDRGIAVDERRTSEVREFSSLIRMDIETEKGKRVAEGTVIGKDEPRLLELDGYHLDFAPEGAMITFANEDKPGVVGKVGTILGKNGINIAELHIGRIASAKRALCVCSTDSPVPNEVLRELGNLEEITDIRLVTV